MQAKIEAAKAAIMAIRERQSLTKNTRTTQLIPGTSGPIAKQSTFDWKVHERYNELHNFEDEDRNITKKSNNMQKVPIIMNWLGLERLGGVQTLNDTEQEKCKSRIGLFKVQKEKLKPQHSETVFLLQFWKLIRDDKENAEWWGALKR